MNKIAKEIQMPDGSIVKLGGSDGEWNIIDNITISNDGTSIIEINTECKEFVIICSNMSTENSFSIFLNNNYIFYGQQFFKYAQTRITIKLINNLYYAKCITGNNALTNASNRIETPGKVHTLKDVNKLEIRVKDVDTFFPNGMNLIVYGR